MFPENLLREAEALLKGYTDSKRKIATAESCTGGMVSALLTAISGCSHMFDMGFITYSNAAKTELLGVPDALIKTHGAVSDAVARAMAEGALKKTRADIAVSVTGIAGPGGGSEEKPVGLVFVACATNQGVNSERYVFQGDRHAIRMQAVAQVIRLARAVC